jgi:hypothetical protein
VVKERRSPAALKASGEADRWSEEGSRRRQRLGGEKD